MLRVCVPYYLPSGNAMGIIPNESPVVMTRSSISGPTVALGLLFKPSNSLAGRDEIGIGAAEQLTNPSGLLL